MKIAIIGAGIAGIAASIRLAHQGHKVQVFEANSYPGGKLSEIKLGAYRFDAGPSLFTMPHYVDELLSIDQEQGNIPFDYTSLKNSCHYFWEDGTQIPLSSTIDLATQQIGTILNEDVDKLDRYLQASKEKYELTGTTFLENSLHQWSTWTSKEVAKALLQLHKLDLFHTMHQVNERIFNNPKTIQLFDRYATYNGSNPYKTPGLLNMIPHLEFGFGVHFPKNGMIQITHSLVEKAETLGVEFLYNQKVKEIQSTKNKIQGVKTEIGFYASDIVISNMDIYYTYKHLLKEETLSKKINRQERSSSALIFYWGIKQTFSQLDLHNILFSEDYRHEFDIMEKGDISDDPTIYINITSKYNPKDAPVNSENWFVMINVPHDNGQDWEALIQKSRQAIIQKINRMLSTDIESLIEVEETLTPLLIQSKTSSFTGSLYGTSSNDKWSAFMRQANFSSSYEGLYFCGGSVHPGGGIPLCLLSGKIVSELIDKKYSN